MSSAMDVAQSGDGGENPSEIERLLGYTFQKPSLLREALTHDSHPDGPSYDRLQYYGNYVLVLVVTKVLYDSNPRVSAELLYALRSSNVSEEKFARAAIGYKLYRFIRHNSPTLDENIREFMDAVRTDRVEDTLSSGAANVLANVVKSLAAAVFIDSNSDLKATSKVFTIILEPIITFENMNEHSVIVLENYCQREMNGKIPRYTTISSREESSWEVRVAIDGDVIGIGFGADRKISKLQAAQVGLATLLKTPPGTPPGTEAVPKN